MAERPRCHKRGHRWIEWLGGWRCPVQFCKRWGCRAARPDPILPLEVQAALDGAIANGTIPQITAPRVLP